MFVSVLNLNPKFITDINALALQVFWLAPV